MNVLAKRWLSLVTAVAVTAVMCFGGIGTAKVSAAEGEVLQKESPAVIITGTGVVDGGKYTEDNIDSEKVYTLDELKAIADKDADKAEGHQYLYSAYNTWDNASVYKVKGVRANAVFADAGVTEEDLKTNLLKIFAEDDYWVAFDPEQQGPAAKEDARITNGYLNERYYFPNITKDNEEEGKVAVPTTIAWAEGGSKGSVEEPKDEDVKDFKQEYVRLITGQLNPKDYNNPMWNGESGYLMIVVGDPLYPEIHINGKDYNRAEIMAKDSLTRAYTYTNKKGEQTDYAKGVPVADFLDAYGDNDLVTFGAADGYSMDPLTKKELVENNYILAYEKGDTADSMNGIYEVKDAIGYFTLYGDGAKPAKLINRVTVQRAQTAPKAPASVKATRLGYSSAKVSWAKAADADGYKVYRYDAKTKKYVLVKTIKSGATLSWTNTGLKTGTTYIYKVKAYNEAGESAFSQTKSITPTLSTPSIKSIYRGKGYATVKWTATAGAYGYKIYRATSKYGTYKLLYTTKSGKTVSYKSTKLKKGQKYYYKVKAYRVVSGKTVYSNNSAARYIIAR